MSHSDAFSIRQGFTSDLDNQVLEGRTLQTAERRVGSSNNGYGSMGHGDFLLCLKRAFHTMASAEIRR